MKSQNVFLTSNGTLKLGDFGISKVLESTMDKAETMVGTPYYMSPEMYENNPYTHKSDIWALGCILYELCTLKRAFHADNIVSLVFKIIKEDIKPIPKHYSSDLAKFVKKILDKNPKVRPSMTQIFKEPIIRKTMQEFVSLSETGKTPL